MTTADPEAAPRPGRWPDRARPGRQLALRAPRGPRPPADVVLPAARRVGAAAHHRPDHGAERLQRLLLRRARRRLLHDRPAPAALGGDRRARAPGSPAGCRSGGSAGSPGPAFSVSLVLLLITAVLGVERQRQHQLARPRPAPDPAVRDRQARGRSCGPRTSTPTRTAGWADLHQIMVPVRAGHARRHRPGHGRQRPRHRAGAASRSCSACSGWSARPPGCSSWLLSVVGVGAFALATTDSERLDRITSFVDPFKDFHDTGWQPAHGLYALSSGGCSARASAPASRSGATLPGGAHRLHLRGARRGARPGRHPAGDRFSSSTIAYAAIRVAREHRGPVRPLHVLRHRGLAARPDDHQRRHGAGAAPRHRHPAAAGVLRRLGAAAVPGRARPADRLRPARARRRRALRPRAGGRSAPAAVRRVGPQRSSMPMRVLLAGGGTAGHTSPLLATADALRRLDPERRDHLPRHAARPGEPGGAGGRLPARADPAGAAAAPARATCSGCRPGCAPR